MNKSPNQYWYVHGEAYDLSSFASVHPGGQDQLFSVQGRDITEMVYSMHSLASIDRVKQIMNKYKVREGKRDHHDLFAWKENGFYDRLSKKVGKYIESLGPKESHKADNMFWMITGIEIAVQLLLVYVWIFHRSYLAAFITGLISISIGFMVFHTAGHCGISKNAKVNKFWFNLCQYILCFATTIWDLHHNYAHHSYTNIYRKDPDVSNAAAVIRKTTEQAYKPIYKFQKYNAYLLLVFFPNQWWGQVMQYALSIKRGKIFGLPMLHQRERDATPVLKFFGMALGLGAFITLQQGLWFAIVSLYLYSSAMGISYWACVFPNHDTDMSEQSNIESVKGTDWGIHQINHSSNFRAPKFLSYFIGGMNYQVEHHLFPCVHPRHYPAISNIVREECAKSNVNYHVHSSWFDALRGNYTHLRAMSIIDKKD